jgi:hypothetical protein
MEMIQSPQLPDVSTLDAAMDPVLVRVLLEIFHAIQDRCLSCGISSRRMILQVKPIQEIRTANLLSEREILRIHSTRALSFWTEHLPTDKSTDTKGNCARSDLCI